jgi:hypothetical protein
MGLLLCGFDDASGWLFSVGCVTGAIGRFIEVTNLTGADEAEANEDAVQK